MAKFYYNGVLLPEIPSDVLAAYPYAWIRFNSENNQYQLYFSAHKWCYNQSNNCVCTNFSNDTNVEYTCVEEDKTWTYSDKGYWSISINDNRKMVWSNHDILNDDNVVYNVGTEPVAETITCYQIKESTLTSFGDQARRINGTTDKLTTAQMLEIFEGAGQGGSSSDGGSKCVIGQTTFYFPPKLTLDSTSISSNCSTATIGNITLSVVTS